MAREALEATLDWSSPEAIHALRRKLRRLRYALEWQHQQLPILAALQTTLGDLNDPATSGASLRELVRSARWRASKRQAMELWQQAKPQVKAVYERSTN